MKLGGQQGPLEMTRPCSLYHHLQLPPVARWHPGRTGSMLVYTAWLNSAAMQRDGPASAVPPHLPHGLAIPEWTPWKIHP